MIGNCNLRFIYNLVLVIWDFNIPFSLGSIAASIKNFIAIKIYKDINDPEH